MKFSHTTNGIPAGNPIANVFVVIVGTLAIAASIVLGFFAFVVVGSLVLILASIVGIRVWWLQRKFQKHGSSGGVDPAAANDSGVIEGEYRVIADDKEGE